jgi:hypothetical protein
VTDRIDRILARVLAPIPPAYKPPPKPRESWQRLKVGMVLELLVARRIEGLGLLEATTRHTITACDSEGVWLATANAARRWRWTDPGWEAVFTKVKAPCKRKEPRHG